VEALRDIGAAHGASSSQVALAWLVRANGDTVVAIPGASRRRHAEENAGALALNLAPAEMDRLEQLSRAAGALGGRGAG
jgi:aryl-alcohol dehydrogenase-like predicted oxidoreductase